MRKIIVIALREFITNVRRPGFVFVTLLIPALGLIGTLISAFAGGSLARTVGQQFTPITRPIGYVNQSPLRLPSTTEFIAYPNQDVGMTALRGETIGALAVIPPDYLATGAVTIYTAGSELFGSEIGTTRLREFLRSGVLSLVNDPQVRERASLPVRPTVVQVGEGGRSTNFNPLSFIIPFLLSILLIVSIFTASGFMLQSVSEEKETRVMEVLLSSVAPTQLLTGKILGLGALGLLQVGVWLGGLTVIALAGLSALSFLTGIQIPFSTLLLGIVYFLLGYLLYATLMAVSGSIATSLREGQQVAAIFTFSAVMPLSFSSLILPRPNGPIAQALSLFPLSSPMMMMIRLAVTTVPPLEIGLSLALLAGFLVFAIWGGARVFRAGLLMYGKRLSVGEIWRALRTA
ncbi:MAG: ABC transporter permease [Anaerolineae bacterium]|nr:ABC transporter permease [Anaerolineae bacterium]